MSYNFYKVLHLTGVLMVFFSLGAAVIRSQTGNSDAGIKKFVGILNGVGLLIAFIAGFGLMAKLGMFSAWDGWILGKITIWLLLGGLLAVMNSKPNLAKPLTFVALILGATAAYLAVVKPF